MWIFQKVHLEGLLGRLDSATMSASVEGRVPFVDHRLVEYVNKVPLKYKIRWKGDKQRKAASQLNSDQISENLDITKFILREAYKDDLPNSISARKKIGFPVLTLQKEHALVQTSPIIINVACLLLQHSEILGQLAS